MVSESNSLTISCGSLSMNPPISLYRASRCARALRTLASQPCSVGFSTRATVEEAQSPSAREKQGALAAITLLGGMSIRFATLYVEEPGEELERLLAHLHRELAEEAAVRWSEPTPVRETTVVVEFTEDATPSAEARVQQVLEAHRDDWSRFLGFASTPRHLAATRETPTQLVEVRRDCVGA